MRAALLLTLPLAGCGGAPDGDPAPEPGPGSEVARPPAEPEPAPANLPTATYDFVDVTASTPLADFQHVCGTADKDLITGSIGAGVALLDYDLDGDLDVYLTNASTEDARPGEAPRDALYANEGDWRFTDVSAAARIGDEGWTTGVRVVDFDADGFPDLYLTNLGPNVLYRNDGAGGFDDVTAEIGGADPGWSTGACFLDFDRDGDLDLYVANYIVVDEELLTERPTVPYKGIEVMKGPRGLPAAHDSFYVNEGGRLRDASEELGIREGKPRFGFQAVAFDMDRDGWVDVFVANDSQGNSLWRNEEGQGFEEVGGLRGLALSMAGKPQAGMGVALGDFDADEHADVFVTNFSDDYFTLYRGTKWGSWIDVSQRMRLVEGTRASLGWACGFEDFDSDGDLEIFVGNGHVYPQVDGFDVGSTYRQRNQLFELDGTAFREVRAGPGFEDLRVSRGAAVGDLDGDGDLDLLFGNLDDRPTLLKSEASQGNWLRVDLVGAGGNRDAVGARVVARVGESAHLRLVGTASGFLSSSEPTLHVGLGDAERVDVLEVTWPSGREDRFEALEANQRVVVLEGGGEEGAARLERR